MREATSRSFAHMVDGNDLGRWKELLAQHDASPETSPQTPQAVSGSVEVVVNRVFVAEIEDAIQRGVEELRASDMVSSDAALRTSAQSLPVVTERIAARDAYRAISDARAKAKAGIEILEHVRHNGVILFKP